VRIFLILFIFSSILYSDYTDYIYKDKNPSLNSFGQVGLINLPSAQTMGEGGIHFTYTSNLIYKYGAIVATPFDWFEASYYYYRPRDLEWYQKPGKYLDKGFNVKLSHAFKKRNINIAIGLDDIAGTGLLSREYIVGTKITDQFKFTLGVGWGGYASDPKKNFNNPLSILSDAFDSRGSNSSKLSKGGNLSTDLWFQGPVNILAGIEWNIPYSRGLKLKIENDPFDYFLFTGNDQKEAYENPKRNKSNSINVGISYPINEYLNIGISHFKGNTWNFTFSFGASTSKINNKKRKFNSEINTKKKDTQTSNLEFYRDLLQNLNSKNLFLQTADYKDRKLKIALSSPQYLNPIQSGYYGAVVSQKVASADNIPLDIIEITNIKSGLELNKIEFRAKDINSTKPIILTEKNMLYKSGNKKEYLKNEYKPKVRFPVVFSSTKPNLINHVGSPAKFYYYGIILQNQAEIQFQRNLILTSTISYDIWNNFDEKKALPDSTMEHVRSELVYYLQQSDDLYLNKIQLEYLNSYKKNLFTKINIGIFEQMYGGIGIETLYKPFNSNYFLGFDAYKVKRRQFDGRFKFLDYQTSTGHINFGYHHAATGILAKLSFGKYLAKDVGYTLDLSRVTKKGVRSGFFFSRTNVSAEEFGEGSFDKGFYFSIPLDIFSRSYNNEKFNFKLRPLTRDGGQKLSVDNGLLDMLQENTLSNAHTDWGDIRND
jgi:hypothetical protein